MWNLETPEMAGDMLMAIAESYPEFTEGDNETAVSGLAAYVAYRKAGHGEPTINGAYGDCVYRFLCKLFDVPLENLH